MFSELCDTVGWISTVKIGINKNCLKSFIEDLCFLYFQSYEGGKSKLALKITKMENILKTAPCFKSC